MVPYAKIKTVIYFSVHKMEPAYFNPEHIIENIQIAPVKITDIKVMTTQIQVVKEQLFQ